MLFEIYNINKSLSERHIYDIKTNMYIETIRTLLSWQILLLYTLQWYKTDIYNDDHDLQF
jgi:hypothetical protein